MEDRDVYVLRKMREDLEESARLGHEEEEITKRLEYEEEEIEKHIKQLRVELKNRGWADDEINREILAQYDASEDALDDLREKITECRNRQDSLWHDYVVFEYYAIRELGVSEEEITELTCR